MQKLGKYLKSLTKPLLVIALILSGYNLIQSHTKYPFERPGTFTTSTNLTKVISEDSSIEQEKQELLDKVSSPIKSEQKLSPAKRILPIEAPKSKLSKKQTIILGKRNTLVFRGVVTQLSVAKLQNAALEMSSHLSPNEPIYLVMDTPGGDVIAGNILIDTLKAIPNKVHTITLFAASMGFHIVENLDDRLILDSGTLMSHRMSIDGVGGQVPGEAVTRLNQAVRLAERMDQDIAKRMGISVETYRNMIQNELWLDGQDAVDQNTADRTVYAMCGEDLRGSHEEQVQILIFNLMLTWSDCPLIRYPINVQQLDSKVPTTPDIAIKQMEFIKYFKTLIYDKEKFVTDYIITGRYKEFTVN